MPGEPNSSRWRCLYLGHRELENEPARPDRRAGSFSVFLRDTGCSWFSYGMKARSSGRSDDGVSKYGAAPSGSIVNAPSEAKNVAIWF
jgi:hypothetical protein